MYGPILLSLAIYLGAYAADNDAAILPFKLDVHRFDQQIEQEYQLHVRHRLKKWSRTHPHHAIVRLYKKLAATSLNQLLKQQDIFEQTQPLYTTIATCPTVIHHFNQAKTSKYKEMPETWHLFKTAACDHLKKFSTEALPPFNPTVITEIEPRHQNAYKTWLIVYFAIKQNKYMGEKAIPTDDKQIKV